MAIKLYCMILVELFVITSLNGCKPTLGRPNDCVAISDCSYVAKFLKSPYLAGTKEYMLSIFCGYKNKVAQVCCPRKLHDNFHLLTQHECGVSDSTGAAAQGTIAGPKEFPWVALLSYKIGTRREFHCSGTLINDKYVLTAAHCIMDNLLGVRIGEHDLNTKVDCVEFLGKQHCSEESVQDFPIDSSVRHEFYSPSKFDNDIGLIRLKGTVDLTKANARPICLPLYPNLRDFNLTDVKMITVGWGATKRARVSDQLLKVTIPVIDNEDCGINSKPTDIYDTEDLWLPKKLCAGEASKDSCKWDSGGLLMNYSNYENRLAAVQFGIVSLETIEKCGAGKPGVYTRVTEYVDWILDNIQP